MKIERINPDNILKAAIISPEEGETEIRIDGVVDGDIKDITIDSDLPVVITGDVSDMWINAPRSEVRFEGDISLVRLAAKSVQGGGSLYPVFGMTVSGDVNISGELTGERHTLYKIGGHLTCECVDVDGHVEVGGVLTADWWDTRSLIVGGKVMQESKTIRVADETLAGLTS